MSRTQTPEILELLSEIEQRNKDSKGDTRFDNAAESPAADLRGFTVLNTTGHDVGRVDDLYIDPNTRDPHYALLNLGNHAFGLGNRHVLVSYDDMEMIGERRVRVRVAVT